MSRVQEFLTGVDFPMPVLAEDTVRLPSGDTHGTGTFISDWVTHLYQR